MLGCPARSLPASLEGDKRGLGGSTAKTVVIKLFFPILLSLASLVGKEFEDF